MYGDFFLVERPGEPVRRAAKLPFGDTRGRNEAWLRDLLFAHPEVLPVGDVDPSFGPLLPLCRELRTEAGPLDLAFVNPAGRLTLVECKLWRNPEARRKVVAQVLDYARAIARWSYSDLQRQVSAATGRRGNVPFEIAQGAVSHLIENHFVDAVTQTMRSGRFLLLIAGDGIREDVGALAELINRNAALGFSFGLVEVALYDLGGAGESEETGLAIQPRVVAKTQTIERGVVLLRGGDRNEYLGPIDDTDDASAVVQPSTMTRPSPATGTEESSTQGGESLRQAAYRRWWQPVLDMVFDDPDQGPPKLRYPNNVRVELPWPGAWITGYSSTETFGVFLSGRKEPLGEAWERIAPDLCDVLAELPEATVAPGFRETGEAPLSTKLQCGTFPDDDTVRDWLKQTLNAYVNALRPRLRRAMELD